MTPIESNRWSIGEEVVVVDCYGEKPTTMTVVNYVGPYSLWLRDGKRIVSASTSLIRTSPERDKKRLLQQNL